MTINLPYTPVVRYILDKIRIIYVRGKGFYQYFDLWTYLPDDVVEKMVNEMIYNYCKEMVTTHPRFKETFYINDVIKSLKENTYLDLEFNRNINKYLPFENGVYDFNDNIFRSHYQTDYFTYKFDFPLKTNEELDLTEITQILFSILGNQTEMFIDYCKNYIRSIRTNKVLTIVVEESESKDFVIGLLNELFVKKFNLLYIVERDIKLNKLTCPNILIFADNNDLICMENSYLIRTDIIRLIPQNKQEISRLPDLTDYSNRLLVCSDFLHLLLEAN